MRVLFVTSEVAPLIKTGGLADVSAALPAALHDMGVDIRVLLPGYPQVLKALPNLEVVADFATHTPPGLPAFPPSRLLLGALPSGVPLYIFDCPEMYLRGGSAYQDEHGCDWADNAQRFGLFSKIAALMGSAATPLPWKPQIVHCNDWQSGLAPAYLHYAKDPAPCVVTVHNLAFQGIFPSELMPELGLPWDCFKPDGVEFYGNLSFLKAGLFYAKHITTVSPSYAREIQSEALGFGLQGLLSHRRKSLSGILNGIDTTEWNPAADAYLVHPYDASDLSGKSANKRELQKRLGLRVDAEIPLFGLVSRFAHQKGLDIVLETAEKLIAMPAQLVILGSGDTEMQRAALSLAHHHSRKIAAYVGFDEGLSHLIEAGADIFLMPSRFEPCGLNQMYSQRYGTPPVVHATGGLIDTVIDCSAATLAQGTASGFVFDKMDATRLLDAAQRAVEVYRNKKSWRALQEICMGKDYGWGTSAKAYQQIYTDLLRR
ncbi:MAG TPA: glycogen synthase GlgA [Gallionellaceae bacterium]|nr:glycogen synthase GlgA [Gallionellaceae bacterium]